MKTWRGIPIVYEDNHLLVAVKPANMPSQADASGDKDMLTLMKEYVKEAYQKPGTVYLGLVHRLDRPVGGLMTFARTSKAAARLSAQLREHSMQREYLAVVCGQAPARADLEHWLSREVGAPQRARLSARRLKAVEGLSLVEVTLETGRKHQIRRQLAMAGMPIWGDARYGDGQPGQQIALFGACLALVHPTTREVLRFSAKPPDKFPWRVLLP